MLSEEPRRVAVVTGAASGIGAAVATSLRRAGFLVSGLDLVASDTDLPCLVDMADKSSVEVAIARTEAALGPISAIVSAAGYYEMLPFSEITPEAWRRMLRVHLGGLTNLVRATLAGMVERGEGTIVAITSELAIGGGSEDAHYAAAKGAIIGFVRSLAAEVAPQGVRVNAVAPGPCDTPLLAPDSSWRDPAYLATLPAGRLASPEEIAAAVQFLVDDGSFVVGEVISVNSGAVI
jgi:2-hydroxycyclohexanecarboxyl-CoA dehydrogenase